jgi:hypothetical protein
VLYDGFSDKGAHSAEWFEVAKNFLKLAFTGDRHEAKCLCNRCQNRWILFEYEMYRHIAKHKFMPNYLVWHQHEEVLTFHLSFLTSCIGFHSIEHQVSVM